MKHAEPLRPILGGSSTSNGQTGIYTLRVRRRLGPCLLGLLLASGAMARGETAVEAWVQRYGFEGIGSDDRASKVVTDAAGNVIVAGDTDERILSAPDMLIIKYSGVGVPLWTNRYDGPVNGGDSVTALAVDASGNVIVTGRSIGRFTSTDFATIKYSAAGVPVWTNRYNGPGNNHDYVSAIAVDASGNVFVTGASPPIGTGNNDYATVAYSAAGIPLWTNRYDGPINGNDGASAIAVDASGNVFVTGASMGSGNSYEYATIKYSNVGIPLWTNRYNGSASASAIAVDGSGNVFVTGSDYATIKYSNAGVPLWTNRYGESGSSANYASAIAVDASGRVFVTGSSDGNGSVDYATVAYSGAGVPLWTNRYNGPGNDEDQGSAIAVDTSGNVLVTGYSVGNGSSSDYATIKYSGAGVPLWTNRYDGPASGYDRANAIAMDASGHVFVTGASDGSGSFNSDWATIAYSGAGMLLWTNRYSGPDSSRIDYGTAVAVDSGGNVFVTGSSYEASGTASDYATIKYSDAGVPLWTNRYNGPGNYDDRATAIAVDASGNVFVTGNSFQGSSSESDYATIAYSGAGESLWTNRYNGPGNDYDAANAIAVDGSGNVFVTGTSAGNGTSYDYATIKYSGAGVPLWTNRYDGPGNDYDGANAIAVDGSGNVFVTGFSIGTDGFAHYATVAYSGAGVPLWTNRFHRPGSGDDEAVAIAVSSSGNVFVTGSSASTIAYPYRYDYLTIAYSGAGVPLWTNRYNGPDNDEDVVGAIAVDASGNVFVTGSSIGNGSSSDYATIKYSGAGVPLWTNRYNGPTNADDWPFAIAADASGNVFVTGRSIPNGGTSDYVTIKYSGAGVPLWTNRYNGPGNGSDDPGGASCLAIGPDGAVYVTGTSDGVPGSDTGYDYATVKYVTLLPKLAIQPLVAGASNVNLTLSGPPSSAWSIERAVALPGPWTNLGPVTIPPSGSVPFQDPSPPKPAAFYRARQP